jgi:transposase
VLGCSFHHKVRLTAMFAAAGIDIKFLPAYSPEFNPIETAFSWTKCMVRRTPNQSANDIVLAVFGALQAITGDLAASWYYHSGFTL